MAFIQIAARDVPLIEAALHDRGIKGVRIAPAFLGQVVVQCPDEATAEILAKTVALDRAA